MTTKRIDLVIGRREVFVPYGPPHHTWQLTEAGHVDTFALDYEGETMGHNGPHCTVCDESFCEHCEPDIYDQLCPGPDVP